MKAHMERSTVTTILFSPEARRRWTRLAQRRGTSLGELVRGACVAPSGLVDTAARLAAAVARSARSLPVGTPHAMKAAAVPPTDTIMP
ncbi:MAG: hypothetical protein FJW29_12135 [Acidobacteria bacterium]|nr:hypothetical protein [Acidobacteriota bacterium]